LWCERVGAHHLEEVRRFDEAWQAEASLALRRGDPEAAAAYAAHGRLSTAHPALLAERVAKVHQRLADNDRTLAITTASAGMARDINVAIQRRRNPGRDGAWVELADGTRAFAGDRIATRRNDRMLTDAGRPVRNRHTWDVESVGADGSLVVSHPERGRVRLAAAYVARHVELGWAVTGYGNQADTLDAGLCVVEPSSTRNGVYVGMTRGRGRNVAIVVDPTGVADPEKAFAAVIARPAETRSALATLERLGGTPPAEPARRLPPRRPAPARRPLPDRQPPPAPERPDPVPEPEVAVPTPPQRAPVVRPARRALRR
ncbi:MAG TPA: AAA family ATPase, partial [Acidimicrobiales bacterium]|nr:AAA family ATPase [Acidimicrobiales bacterium]